MSTLMQRNTNDPNDPIYYAPRWLRDQPSEPPPRDLHAISPVQPPRMMAESQAQRPSPINADEEDSRLAQLLDEAEAEAMRASLRPDRVLPPFDDEEDTPRRYSFGKMFLGASAGAICAVVVLGFLSNLPLPRHTAMTHERTTIVVSDGSGYINQMVPLGVRVIAPIPGATVDVNGLPPGATMTTGAPTPEGDWRVPLQDLAGTFVVPPSDFSGEARLSIVLRAASGEALVNNTLRVAWQAPPASPAAPAPPTPAPTPSAMPVAVAPQPMAFKLSQAPVAPPATETVRQIDPRELAVLLKRAEDLIVAGDIVPARSLLQRAAEAHNARAAFMLASTYDPNQLKKFGMLGPTPNLELAQTWYQKAKAWGFKEAEPRSETIAIYGR